MLVGLSAGAGKQVCWSVIQPDETVGLGRQVCWSVK